MRGTFGDAISDRLMIPYARKIWTVEPDTMDFDWIGRRVPTPDVERIILGALTDDVEQIGATAQFWYPWRGGIEALPTALAKRVGGSRDEPRGQPRRPRDAASSRVRTGTRSRSTTWSSPCRSTCSPTGSSTFRRGSPTSAAGSQYQGIFNVNVGVNRPSLSDAHWVYFYEDAFPFHRLSFPGNFSPHNVPEGKSSVSVEVAFSRGRPLDREAMIEPDAGRASARGDPRPPTTRSTSCTPRRSRPHTSSTTSSIGATSTRSAAGSRSSASGRAGRFGEWGYLNMDHAMASGRAAGEAVLRSRAA